MIEAKEKGLLALLIGIEASTVTAEVCFNPTWEWVLAVVFVLLGCLLAALRVRSTVQRRKRATEVEKALVPDLAPTQAVGSIAVHGHGGSIGIGIAGDGCVAISGFTTAQAWTRLWRLVSNPFLYVVTGRIRW